VINGNDRSEDIEDDGELLDDGTVEDKVCLKDAKMDEDDSVELVRIVMDWFKDVTPTKKTIF